MPNLELVESEWIELYDKLCRDPDVGIDRIAAPFLSVPASEERSILYVGKATDKDWHKVNAWCRSHCASNEESTEKRVEERREWTKEFLADGASDSAFWRFAQELDEEAAKKWKPQVRNSLQHITWTNICKIGRLKGNPSGPLFSKQQKLAVKTLDLEVKVYRPNLIYLVTLNWGIADDVIRKLVGDPTDSSWDQTGDNQKIWWRRATTRFPAILWTGHPQGKSAQMREQWLKKASELLPD